MGPLVRMVLAALPLIPRPLMRRLASRYFAGERLEEALHELASLAARGHPGIVDILGEDVTSERSAREVLAEYAECARRVRAAELDAYVSVKPTHFGLRVSEALCLELYAALAAQCRDLDLFVRVEMEDQTTTDATLRVFEELRTRFDNVGIVLQSRLFRTPEDIARLAPGPLDVRMVKGIYLEPPEIAHTEPEPIREAFVTCTRSLFERGARVRLATHDDRLGGRMLEVVRELGLGGGRYEFEVLMGVREELWERWKEQGHVVRVYVPYGPEWRAYSLRRLRKNPEILRHLMRQTLGLS